MSSNHPKLRGEWLQNPQTTALMNMFAQSGTTARFVGGVVRNALLDEPVNDLDIAVDAPPEMVMQLAQKAGFKAVGTGLDHGTVTIVVEGRVHEVTTLRVDVETDGRHASVNFTRDWVKDAARRDFTMNALYADADGTLFDPLNGYDDLIARRVRFIGPPEDRINEDRLRILRFFRFSAQYGQGAMDAEGLAACERLQRGLTALSAERIRAELLRLLQMPGAYTVLNIMFEHGLLQLLAQRVPHLARLKNWIELEGALDRVISPVDRLAALFILVPEDAEALAQRLRLSRQEKRILSRWALERTINETLSEKQAQKLSYLLGEDYQATIAISWVINNGAITNATWRKLHDLPERWQRPDFPLKGQDLLDNGMTAGPSLGKKLHHLEKIWLESDFDLSKEQLLAKV